MPDMSSVSVLPTTRSPVIVGYHDSVDLTQQQYVYGPPMPAA